MTTIAYKNGILAADKRAVYGNLSHAVTKVRKLKDGSLVGASGELSFHGAMFEWLEAGADPAKFPVDQRSKEDWQPVLCVTPAGEIRIYERTPYPVVSQGAFFAIGSGRDFAIMAMRLGKSAAEAVALAAEFDAGTGLGVDTVTLDQPFQAGRIHLLESYPGHALAGSMLARDARPGERLQKQFLQEPGHLVPGRA